MAYRLAWEEPRAVVDLVHVEKFFARNLGGLTRARTCAGPAREGKSRTPSMYADEKSDEVVVPRKRPNKGRQLPAEVVEGRASPEGNSRQAAVRNACGFKPRATDVRPEGGPRCVSSARRDPCGGRGVILVPTVTIPDVYLMWMTGQRLATITPKNTKALMITTNARRSTLRLSRASCAAVHAWHRVCIE